MSIFTKEVYKSDGTVGVYTRELTKFGEVVYETGRFIVTAAIIIGLYWLVNG